MKHSACKPALQGSTCTPPRPQGTMITTAQVSGSSTETHFRGTLWSRVTAFQAASSVLLGIAEG
jgi:hypothetical protein